MIAVILKIEEIIFSIGVQSTLEEMKEMDLESHLDYQVPPITDIEVAASARTGTVIEHDGAENREE